MMPEPTVAVQTSPKRKKRSFDRFRWSYLGLNQGLTDYESATLTN